MRPVNGPSLHRVDHKWVDGQQRYSAHSAWAPDFPKAVAQTTRANIMAKYADLFKRAKAGDVEAAEELVEKVVKVDKVRQLGKDHPNAKIVAPVVALEATGHNQIPRMYARYIASILGIEADDGIVQTVRAKHTGSDAQHRLFVQPEFDGPVEAGAEYIVVDDHITQGGTVNALRDHIESNGGKVVAVSSLTLSQGSSILSPRKETLDELKAKWPDIDNLLQLAGVAVHWGLDWFLWVIPYPTVELTFENHCWQKQEVLKGMATVAGTLSGGWGFNVWSEYDHLLGEWRSVRYSPEGAAAAVASGSITNRPAFATGGAAEMRDPNATENDVFLALAKHVPALSSPVGGSAVLKRGRDFDLNDARYRNGWGRVHKNFGVSWLHSDMKDMAYFYVYKLYDEIVNEKGSLK